MTLQMRAYTDNLSRTIAIRMLLGIHQYHSYSIY